MLRYLVLVVFALSAWLVTAQAQEPVAPLTLELTSSRELCTAGTPTEISWQIAGGVAPYTLSIEGEPVDADAESHRVNCGALTEAEAADEDAPLAAKQITATATDSRGVQRQTSLDVPRARPLPPPTNVRHEAVVGEVIVEWDRVEGAGSQSPMNASNRRRVTGVIRTRANLDGAPWTHQTVTRLYADDWVLGPTSGVAVLSVAAVRHPLEVETPSALNWSDELVYASTTVAQNVTLAATHDTITVSWDRQPYVGDQQVWVWLFKVGDSEGWRQRMLAEQRGVSGRHTVTFTHLPADTELRVWIEMHDADAVERANLPPNITAHRIRTLPAPRGWNPSPAGPQNLRHTQTDGVITILWDAPYPDAEQRWYLTLEHPATGTLWRRWLYSTSWTWTTNLTSRAAAQYRVTVEHVNVPRGSASILITTSRGPTTDTAASPRSAPPLFEWWANGRPTTPLLYLQLTSSRNLCTAGTPTEISWQIAGGVPPYALSIEGEPVDAAADNVRVICGARAEPQAPDTDDTLEPKRVTATATDSRGVQRKASLDVPRARALPPPLPSGITVVEHRTIGSAYWDAPAVAVPELEPAHYLARWRAVGSETWTYDESARELPNSRWNWSIGKLREGTRYELAIAAMRDQAEQLTPQALHWSSEIPFRTVGPPQNIVATSTHNSITVTWDAQPGNLVYAPYVTSANGAKDPSRESVSAGTHQAVFVGLQPDTEYDVVIPVLMTEGQEVGARTTIRTEAAPPDWQPPPTGPQNLRTTAAANSITAVWEAPHAQASPLYLVSLTDPETGLRVGHPRIIERTSFTFEGLLPETQYAVVITHLGIVEHGSSRVVTTAPASSGGVRGRQSARSEIPFLFASLTR